MTSSANLENLARLASKPGVQSTLILSRVDGAIIRATGLLFSEEPSSGDGVGPRRPENGNHAGLIENLDEKSGYASEERGAQKSAEDVAKMVFNFISTASGLVNDLDKDDDLQLVRLRTKGSEIVMVPDLKYLLVVLYDPPKPS